MTGRIEGETRVRKEKKKKVLTAAGKLSALVVLESVFEHDGVADNKFLRIRNRVLEVIRSRNVESEAAKRRVARVPGALGINGLPGGLSVDINNIVRHSGLNLEDIEVVVGQIDLVYAIEIDSISSGEPRSVLERRGEEAIL